MIDIRGLAYVVTESTDIAQWKAYAEDVLGMMTAPAPGGGLYVKMDERQFRIAVQAGPGRFRRRRLGARRRQGAAESCGRRTVRPARRAATGVLR